MTSPFRSKLFGLSFNQQQSYGTAGSCQRAEPGAVPGTEPSWNNGERWPTLPYRRTAERLFSHMVSLGQSLQSSSKWLLGYGSETLKG